MKTIQVDDQTYDFLLELSTRMNSQSNRATASPYFFQVQETKEVAAGDGAGDEVWVCDGSVCIRNEEDIREAVFEWNDWDLENAEHLKLYDELCRWEKEDILQNNYRKAYVSTEQFYKNFFFTEEACKEHIRANRHNLHSPVDYLSYAERNPELKKVIEFLCSIEKTELR